MDRKSIIVLIVCFLIMIAWYPILNKIYPPKPQPHLTNVVSRATNQVAEVTNVPVTPAPSTPAIQPALALPPGTKEITETLTNENGRYIFSSFGGGLKSVELVGQKEVITCTKADNNPDNVARLNAPDPTPVLALRPTAGLEYEPIFQLTRIPGGVKAERQLSNGVFLVKEFQISSNFLVNATVRFENRSAQKITLPEQEWYVGTATPLPQEAPQMLGVYWYNGSKENSVALSYFSDKNWACMPKVPPPFYAGGQSNVVWTAVHNQFFTLAVMPKVPAQRVIVTQVPLPLPPTNAAKAPPPKGLQTAIVYPARTLDPNQSFQEDFSIFAGPKEYRTLQRIGLAYNNNLDLIMGYSGFFGFFAKLLLLSMNGIHSLGLGYALSIIAITVIIKIVFWPLTQVSTRSMKRMQTLQPQIKALQEKYKDDPAKMNRKMMEFMKEHKVNPMGGCLPMLIQIPVFFGFYRMIQNAIELRGARFLWVCDLSRPDTLFMIPGINFPFNPLPLIMGVTMLWQARMTPTSPGMDPAQQKIMKYMPLIFLVMLYNFSSGLTLYWTVQNLLTIAQMKLTRMKDDTTAGKTPGATPGHKKK